MSVVDSVRDLQNTTASEQARTALANRNGTERRTANDVMGRHDFLMLLSAQLRHQDPLNPQSDSDFAAQLAQFSSLEQMMNMSDSLDSMQAFSLVGQYVISSTMVDGRLMEIAGVVDSVFTMDGRKFAQIGEHAVPVSDINEIFDGSVFNLPEQLIQTSNNLLGRTVMASIGSGEEEEDIEGIVIGVSVERGLLHATVRDADGEEHLVPVGRIFEIRETPVAETTTPPPPVSTERPPLDIPGATLIADGENYIELDGNGDPIRVWSWSPESGMWIGENVVTAPPVEQPPVTDGNGDDSEVEEPYPDSSYKEAGNTYNNYGGSYTSQDYYNNTI